MSGAEEWRAVAGVRGEYQVSSKGGMRSIKRGKVRDLQPGLGSGGYRMLALYLDGRPVRHAKVHILVAEAFIGPRPSWAIDIRHLDGDPLNNAVENLCYGTRSENCIDAVVHGANRQATRTHCPQGHPYDEANTYHAPTKGQRAGRDHRTCRECNRQACRHWRAKRKAVAA